MKKIIAITGASSGIGRATARMMVDEGHIVYDLSRSDKPQDGVKHIRCDIVDVESVANAIQTIKLEQERLDVLVLCAGMGVAGAVEFTSDVEMKRQFDVNFFGSIHVAQAVLPLMREQEKRCGERGRIVFISSMAGVFALPYQAMYSASKAAINSIVFSLRAELKHTDVNVTCVMPGDVQTNFQRSSDSSCLASYPNFTKALRQMEKDEANGLTSNAVAKRVVLAAFTSNPNIYYTSDYISDAQRFLARVLPSKLINYIVGKMYHC